MSSLLTAYAQHEQQKQQLEKQLEEMRADPRLQAEIEFKDKLEALMKDYEKSAADVIALLDPKPASSSAAPSTGVRRKRKLKIYKNPNTGEVVETRGGNQKTLKAWKEEFGDETVESWLVRTED
ncbi:DNA binding protein [Halomonas sp. LR5S13]|uniref:histone-like nucleoid-structuring protein, MvaT/MvaU family n=1 Tax=Halomonas rhizosphaerae TaxID=3043296 RepID=UPI0024A881D8|nr:histone-like nucleoid-structuring protein, MvaT/MvaU family [Halomonas rhizosphaerae]MDI5922482.1 DNA binding protein [Halomonas rhizosphaerae]